jgi:hypothetical protein
MLGKAGNIVANSTLINPGDSYIDGKTITPWQGNQKCMDKAKMRLEKEHRGVTPT